jgi:hypothetical protein
MKSTPWEKHIQWKDKIESERKIRWQGIQDRKPMSFLEQQVHDDMVAEGYTNYEDFWSLKLGVDKEGEKV